MNLVQTCGRCQNGFMSQSQKPTTDELRQRTKEEARQLLAEGGPEQVKARVLAVRLGISVGSIYNLFGQLDELLFLVNADVYDELLAVIEEAIAKTGDKAEPIDRVLALCRAYLRFVTANQGLWSGVLAFNRRNKPSVPKWYREKERSLLGTAAAVLTDVPGPASPAEKELAARATWAAIHGIVTISVGPQGLLATEKDIAAQIELVARAIVRALESGEPWNKG
ncbi:TetR/AcrR family transcriptional regulator [Parvularcula marina]|uniref:TetR/AcrR family transcriptional regulator n=2 Tax=Parvularcula marina TaxID=2292771 RepID=A0A371RKT0_9PROT|nr:TetR/AcrR family transcriptional regulator [Parvularcula marina]